MFIDLTLIIDESDPIITKAKNDPERWYMSQGHIGTHMDVPPGIEPPPAEYTLLRGILIDVESIKKNEIGIEVLQRTRIGKGDAIVFHTGHIREFSYGTSDYFAEQPRLSWDLIKVLAENDVSLIALDFPGLRPGLEHAEADMLCGQNGKYIIENLTNVDRLRDAVRPSKPFSVLSGWTGFKGATGLSCRVTAKID